MFNEVGDLTHALNDIPMDEATASHGGWGKEQFVGCLTGEATFTYDGRKRGSFCFAKYCDGEMALG